MSSRTRKILIVDLNNNKSDVKSYEEYGKYIGGIGLNAKILNDLKRSDVVSFSVGPLNGFFPCVSKTSVLFKSNGEVENLYLGGTLSSRIKFTGLDAIVIFGVAEESVSLEIIDEEVSFKTNLTKGLDSLGLPGKRGLISIENNTLLLDHYFEAPSESLRNLLKEKNIESISITGTKTFEVKKKEKYEELYYNLLEKCKKLDFEQLGVPSCFGCPHGCSQAKLGDEEGDVLLHSLVACSYADDIYTDVGTVFSCLDVLGYKYKHEDLENFPNVVYDLIKELNSNE